LVDARATLTQLDEVIDGMVEAVGEDNELREAIDGRMGGHDEVGACTMRGGRVGDESKQRPGAEERMPRPSAKELMRRACAARTAIGQRHTLDDSILDGGENGSAGTESDCYQREKMSSGTCTQYAAKRDGS
jgi:hypothetical protein